MNKLIISFICLSLLSCLPVMAREEVLAVITNDENKDVFTFIASTDDQTQAIKSFYKDDYVNGKKIDREFLSSDELSKDGVILDKRGERTVINLTSQNFNLDEGGNVTIDTLYNGVTGERKQYEVEIVKDLNGWKLLNNNEVISKLHIEVNKKMLIGTVGVKNIRME